MHALALELKMFAGPEELCRTLSPAHELIEFDKVLGGLQTTPKRAFVNRMPTDVLATFHFVSAERFPEALDA